jgi:hypothetical protein
MLNVSEMFGEDAANALNDVLRMFFIQFTVQILLYFNDPNCSAFMTSEFILLSMYILMGVLVYWLIIRKIIQFE